MGDTEWMGWKKLMTLTAFDAVCFAIKHNCFSYSVQSVFSFISIVPSMIFFNQLRLQKESIWFYANLLTTSWGIGLCFFLQLLANSGYPSLDLGATGGGLFHAAAFFYILYIFPQICVAAEETVVNGPITMLLPGEVAVGIAFLPGSLMDTVVRSSECRVAVLTFSCYIAFVSCTLVCAAAAAWLNLVTAETTLTCMDVLWVVSFAYYIVIFFYTGLTTRHASIVPNFIVFPAALAATFLLHATNVVSWETIVTAGKNGRFFIWILFHLFMTSHTLITRTFRIWHLRITNFLDSLPRFRIEIIYH